MFSTWNILKGAVPLFHENFHVLLEHIIKVQRSMIVHDVEVGVVLSLKNVHVNVSTTIDEKKVFDLILVFRVNVLKVFDA